MVIYLHFLLLAQRYDNFKLISRHVMAKLNMAYLPSLKKPVKKTAVVLIAGVTISGTYSVPACPRHFTVPFGAEAPSGHVGKAWAILPPSWGLLSQFCARCSVMIILN